MKTTQQKAIDKVSSAIEELETLIEQIRDRWECRSESWQESDKGESAMADIENLQEYLDELQNIEEPTLA